MERPLFRRPPSDGPLAARLAENVPRLPMAAPILVAQGLADTLVLPDVQERFVLARCAAGQTIDYRTYVARDHLSLLADHSPMVGDLIAWTRERFAGAPGVGACRTVAR